MKNKKLQEARELWKTLGNVPVNNDGEIDCPWHDFPIGTDTEEIWHWFEETFDVSVVEDLMHDPINLNLKLSAIEGSLNITGDFHYSCMFDMYNVDGVLRDGEGLQVDESTDKEKAMVLCRAIAKAVKKYVEGE